MIAAGVGGFSGFTGGAAGGFNPFPDGGMCFDCGGGCLDCGRGCDCSINGNNVPAWQPPFGAIGAPGWRASKGAFCGGLQDTWGFDVWSDSTGVYVGLTGAGFAAPDSVTDDDAGVAMPTVGAPAPQFMGVGGAAGSPADGEFVPRTRVWHNDGSGWALRLDGQGGSMTFGMTGLGQQLVLYTSPLPEEAACRLGMTTRGGFACLDVDPIQDVAAVNRSLGYALMGTRLLAYDGSAWRGSTALLPYPAFRIWADASDVIAVGTAGTVLRLRGESWVLEDPGVLEGLTAIWGTSGDDVWVGTQTGKLLHYDGSGWTQRAQLGGKTCAARQPIIGIWGSGDVVYVHTPTELERLEGGELESLGNWTCGLGNTQEIRAIWGTSENDLFVGLVDQSVGSPCGSTFVAYYDGAEFHRL